MKARILVVEDERAIQLALSGLLGRAGYEVLLAGSGEEAIEKLEESVPPSTWCSPTWRWAAAHRAWTCCAAPSSCAPRRWW